MWKYILKRLLLGAVTILIVSFLMYLLLWLLPEKPYSHLIGRPNQSAETIAAIRHRFGADEPFIQQYLTFMKNLLHGDLGDSLILNKPVSEAIKERVGPTLILMGFSYFVQLVIAIPVGIISAVKQYSKLDNFVTAASFFGISLPNFWFGSILIYAFAIPHNGHAFFPVGDIHTGDRTDLLDLLWHLTLPTIVLAVQGVAVYARYTRSAMLEVLSQDYIRTARAKGLPQRAIVLRHAFRNSLLPLITLVGLDLPQLFVGAVITEYVFNWPGLGRRFVEAAQSNDISVLLGILIVLSVLVVIGNLIADLVYTRADPRISYEGAH